MNFYKRKKQVKLKEKIETTSACPKPRPSWSIGRFMLNRPNQSTNNQQQNQTSQSKSTAKWKTYDDPVQIPILMYHAVHVMDPSEASNANLIVAPDNFEAQIKAW